MMEQRRFDSPISSAGGADDRRSLRRSIKVRAQLRDRGQTRFEIEVVDISSLGFRAQTSFTLWPGTVVWLTLPGFALLEATVAWREHATYGCAFTRALDPAVFDRVVELGDL